MKNIISMLNKEVKGMDKMLCTFKKPKYLFQHNQIEPVKSTSGQIILASLDKTSNERDALSVAILEGYQHLQADDIKYKYEFHTDLKSKYMITFNQDYVLDILKANKKTKAFELKLKGTYDIMEFNFNDVTYFLCPIRPSDLPYEKLAGFKN